MLFLIQRITYINFGISFRVVSQQNIYSLVSDIKFIVEKMQKTVADSLGKGKDLSQIRSTGYELSSPITIAIPTYQQQSSFLSSLFNLVGGPSNEKKLLNPNAKKEVTILSDKSFFVTKSNKFCFFHYSIIDDKMEVEERGCFLLSSNIEKLIFTTKKNESISYVILGLENKTISLFSVKEDRQPELLEEIKFQKKVLALQFVPQSDLFVVLQSGKILWFGLKNNKLHEVQSFELKIQENSIIQSCEISGIRQSPERIFIFFTTLRQNPKRSALNLVEMKKTMKKICFNQSFPDIFQANIPETLLTSLTIYSFQNSFLIKDNNHIWVLQHKFGRYVKADAVSDLKEILKLFVVPKDDNIFLCSIGDKEIELWEMTLKDVGCKCNLLDVIEGDGQELAPKMLAPWIFKGNNKIQLAFLVDKDLKSFDIFLTRKKDKMHKLIEKVRKYEKNKGDHKYAQRQFKARIHQIQELGEKLGFQRRQLYLSLWQKNEKNSPHIFQYLLPCLDFDTIFKELEQYMREKVLSISELVKILKKIENNILEQLKKKLEVNLFRWYLKANFQRRKLKLYSSELRLDFEKYERIYKMSLIEFIRHHIDLKLFPKKFHHDIVWKEQDVQTPLEIHYILRQFRLIILEDYPSFLYELLQPYMDCLPKVLDTFYDLLPQFPLKISLIREELVKLSNIYPSQKIEEDQHFWLGFISELEWRSQESSVHYLFNHLFDHYDTSHIQDKIKDFCNKKIVVMERNKQFVLLESERQDFEKELPKIGEATSILHLCEVINRRALKQQKESQSEQILTLMMKKNKLPEHEFTTFVRLSKLQIFLIKQKMIDPETTIIQLMNMSEVQIVRIFFWEKKAKINLLFEVVSKMYLNQGEFDKIIRDFVNSEECSKVELTILAEYIKSMPIELIEQNMSIINIIIDGFFKRIEIREIDKAIDFLQLFRQLPLSEELLKKMSFFESVKTSCYRILRELGLGKLTYDVVISDVNTVIETLVGNYFSHFSGKDFQLSIGNEDEEEIREVKMVYPENLFVIVLYFKDKIYSFREELQTFLAFGYALVTWNQFDLLRKCFKQDLTIDDEKVTAEEFYLILVENVLSRYLVDQEMIYDEQTNDHLKELLALIDDDEALKIVETAKIEFAGILEELDFKLTLQYMETIRNQWSQGREERIAIFREIIDNFAEKVTFTTFQAMYHYLEVIRLETNQIDKKSQEMVELTQEIYKHLFAQKKYLQICEIISFWNEGQSWLTSNFNTMTECFLQVISQYEFNGKLDLDTCLLTINYYLAYFHDHTVINGLFKNKFTQIDLEEAKLCQQIVLDLDIINSNEGKELMREQVWQMICTVLKGVDKQTVEMSKISIRTKTNKSESRIETKEKEVKTKDLLFIYFFICQMLQNSSFLLNLQEISFWHEKIIVILHAMTKNQKYSQVNFLSIVSKYMKGLFKIYYSLVNDDNEQGVEGDSPRKKVHQIQRQAEEIESFENDKMLALISEIKRLPQAEFLYYTLRRLTSFFKNLRQKELELFGKALIELAAKPRTEKQISSSPKIQKVERPLNESITNFDPEQSCHRKIYRFSQFEKIKRKHKGTITNEKKLVEKVLGDLQHEENNLDSQNSAEDICSFTKKFHQSEKGSKVDIQLESVLCDLKSEEDVQQNDTIMLELYSLDCIECDQEDYKNIEKLIIEKKYQAIKEKYHKGVIIKALVEYFYSGIEVNPVIKEVADIFKPKRLKRAQTYHDPVNKDQLKIVILLETLKNLELCSNMAKVRYLRQSLALLSSFDLFNLEKNILAVFKLNVLLDPSRNPKKIIKVLLNNIECLPSISLDNFEKLMKVVDFFVSKCFEDRKKTEPISMKRDELEESNYQGEMYLIYLKKMLASGVADQEMVGEVTRVMKLLGSQKLADIHQAILNLLESHVQLKEHYVLSIYSIFVPIPVQ